MTLSDLPLRQAVETGAALRVLASDGMLSMREVRRSNDWHFPRTIPHKLATTVMLCVDGFPGKPGGCRTRQPISRALTGRRAG